MKSDTLHQKSPALDQMAALKRENSILAQQVKKLIKAESKLYEYQEELDQRLKEYRDLYDFNRKLNSTFDLRTIFRHTVEYAVQNLEYERAVLFHRPLNTDTYHVYALDGYYSEQQKNHVSKLTIKRDDPLLSPLVEGKEYLICMSKPVENDLMEYRAKLLMNEYFMYPLASHSRPRALLAVGNSGENPQFYRRVACDSHGTLLSMGNLVGVVSASIENYIFYHKMERALEHERLMEAKFHSIFENAIEGIFQRTPAGKYLDVNPSLARMLGYASPQELIETITNIGQEVYVRPERHAELISTLEEHGVVEGFETQLYRKDRSWIWVSVSARAVYDSTGRLSYYEGTIADVTERKRAEEALLESEKKYRQLSEALKQRVVSAVAELRQKDQMLIMQGRQAVMGEMISNIAHQWRQPLNLLGLLAQDMQMTQEIGGLTKEFFRANVDKTMEIIQQMSKTIDDFRHFFKPDKEKAEFSVPAMIQQAVSFVQGSFRELGIRTEIIKTADPVITGYSSQFSQVLLNILFNARDALMVRKVVNPEITIKLETEGSTIVVSITDNAGGIPVEIIDKIFEPYFTTKGPEQGTGIGLFMCKTIIEKNMHGSLKARNVGGGAEFRIELA